MTQSYVDPYGTIQKRLIERLLFFADVRESCSLVVTEYLAAFALVVTLSEGVLYLQLSISSRDFALNPSGLGS